MDTEEQLEAINNMSRAGDLCTRGDFALEQVPGTLLVG